jgi:hypothetical protein
MLFILNKQCNKKKKKGGKDEFATLNLVNSEAMKFFLPFLVIY